MREIIDSTLQTIRNEWKRVFLIFLCALFFYSIFYFSQESKHREFKFSEIFFHISAEFVGSIIIFLFLEHGIKRIEKLQYSGIKELAKLPLFEFLHGMKVCKSEIIILDTYLETFVNSNDTWYKFQQTLREVFVNPNIRVNILIVCPKSDAAKQRSQELNPNNPESVINDMIACIKRLYHFKTTLADEQPNSKKGFEINIFDATPPFALYSHDKNSYISFFPIGEKSVTSQQLNIPSDTFSGSKLFDFFEKKFYELWRDEKTISIVDYYSNNFKQN